MVVGSTSLQVAHNLAWHLFLPNQTGISGRLEAMPYHVEVKLLITQLKMLPDISSIPLHGFTLFSGDFQTKQH